MIFLKWWQPSTWLSGVNDSIVGGVVKALRTLLYSITVMIYKLVIFLCTLFDRLCNGRLLDSEILEELSKRVGLVLGIVMLFFVILSFIKLVIDPDKITDGKQGAAAIIKKVLIVIVMLGISSFAFETLYHMQHLVIKNHVISKMKKIRL